jgi:hypothetical protein
MKNTLLVYTGIKKTAPDYIRNRDVFVYPFTHMISRTKTNLGFFNFDLKSEKIDSILSHRSKASTFDECCDLRAAELAHLNLENYFILWSGGIDSSVALASILKNWSEALINRLTVVLTYHSIEENPAFFRDHVSKLKLLNYFEALPNIFKANQSIVITGELGDQLFGAGIVMPACRKFGSEILSSDYNAHGPAVLEQYLLQDSRKAAVPSAALFDYIKVISDECPFKIGKVAEFFWWFNFTQEWQFAKFKFLEHPSVPTTVQYGKSITHFFDTSDFQKWSITSMDERIPANWSDYKSIAKEYIYKFSKNASDLELIKRQSLKNTYFLQSFRIATSSDQNEVTSYEELEKYVRS